VSAVFLATRRELWAFNAVTQVVSINESVFTRVADLLRHVVNGNIIKEAIPAIEEPHVRVVVPATRVVTTSLTRGRRPWLARMAARRKLVVQVEMGCAAILLVCVMRSMPCADSVLTLFSDILILVLASGLVLDISELARVSGILVGSPGVLFKLATAILEINLDANPVALVVHLLAVLVEAILLAAGRKQLFRSWLFEKHVHIALNLLSCGPVDLAVLFKALLGLAGALPLCLAITPTLIVTHLTIDVLALIPLTIASLAIRLLAVAVSINLHILVV